MSRQRPLVLAARPLAVALLLLNAGTPAAAEESPASLDALLTAAMSRNPGVTRLVAQAAMLEHRVHRASAWESPMLGVSLLNLPVDSFRLDRDPMSMVSIELKQTLPFPGKNGRREAVARAEADAATLDVAEAKAALTSAMRQAFVELTFIRQDDDHIRAHVALIAQMQQAAREKYENGKGRQEDLWRLEAQLGVLDDERQELRRQETQLMSALNAAAHRPLGAPIATPESLELAPAPPSLADLLAAAVGHRPALAAAIDRHEGAVAAADLAAYEAWPDVSVFAGYGIRQRVPSMSSGTDMVSVGLSFMLPVFYGSSFGAETSAMAARADMAAAEKDGLVTDLEHELADGLADWQRAQAQARIYGERVEPTAARTVDAVLSSYRADQADFTELFEAEVMLLDAGRTLCRAIADTHRARARVEGAIGHTLP